MKRKKVIILSGIVWLLGTVMAGCSFGAATDSGTVSVQETDLEARQNSSLSGAQADGQNLSGASISGGQEGTGSGEGRWQVLAPEIAEVVDADFVGTVWKLDEDSFWIAEEHIILNEDGSLSSSHPSSNAQIPDSELIRVVFDDDTYFYIHTVKNGGESYEDAEAGFQDLEEHMSVDLKGSFTGEEFHATEIRIDRVE